MSKFLNISTDNTLGGSSASDNTVSSQKAVKDYVDNVASGKANDSDVVKLTGNQTIAGDKTFTGYIKGEAVSNTNHAINLGHNQHDYMDFYEYGAVWNFYKSRGNTNTLVAKITETYMRIPTPTEDTTSSVQADTVGARNTKLANYALNTAFTGADGTNAGVKGLVPAPTATDNTKFLKGDGTWGTPSGGASVSTGVIWAFGGSTAPDGWLLCDGSAVSKTTYSDLFAVIGTSYGTGDGSTTFNLPNFTNMCAVRKTGSVKVLGNGKTLGLTQGRVTGGLSAGNAALYANLYNKNVGTSAANPATTDLKSLGVVTSGESGIVADLTTLGSQTMKAIIKY